ncbi:unnamed protein product, partial [marine sediment metagenome]
GLEKLTEGRYNLTKLALKSSFGEMSDYGSL